MRNDEKLNKYNNYSGILLIDKPLKLSSNQILQRIKRLYQVKKAGHTGSLDPLATGMLPICLGEATKFSQYLLDSDKTYQVQVQLGIKTTTGDAEGEVIAEKLVPQFTVKDIEQALKKFEGEINQIPSMYSALKFNGRPLYSYARQGIEIERKSRIVTIYFIQLKNFENNIIDLVLKCSKGTYVRTLAEDLGEYLACGAFVKTLRRLGVGAYPAEAMVTEDKLLKTFTEKPEHLRQYILPTSSMVCHLPKIFITEDMLPYLKKGQAVFVPKNSASGLVQIFLKEGELAGIGEVLNNGMLAPRRILRNFSIP